MAFENEESFAASSVEEKYESAVRARANMDRDFLCPICLHTMKDAFLTRCGHNFCYSCIMTHLKNRNNCPCCAQYLTIDLLMPNFLLTKLMNELSASMMLKNASPAEQLRLALEQDADLPPKELDSLLLLLNERKQKLDREEAEINTEIIFDFLHRLQFRKLEAMKEVQSDLQFLKDDIATVERRLRCLLASNKSHSKRVCEESPLSDLDIHTEYGSTSTGGAVSMWRSGQSGAYTPPGEEKLNRAERIRIRNLAYTSVSTDIENDPSVDSPGEYAGAHKIAKKRRVLAQFEELQGAYFLRRRQIAFKECQKQQSQESVSKKGAYKDWDTYDDGLDDFQSILTTYTRYSQLRVVAELHHDDPFQPSSNIVSSIDFDGDDQLFATAGVTRRIKIFNFATVIDDVVDVHCPVTEIPTRSKLSCLSWNKLKKPLVASSDYEGIIAVWDVNRSQVNRSGLLAQHRTVDVPTWVRTRNIHSVVEYEEHEKRAWSVDFSCIDPSMMVSGSDDGKVKVWCINQDASAFSIDMKANICCVKYNPGSSNHIAIGSSDHHIHYYDLRNLRTPLFVFKGHRKAVSYVKFMSSNELVSASTDSTLRLWDVQTDTSVCNDLLFPRLLFCHDSTNAWRTHQ
uniref:RING-type domain-containing protein n=1 Tax=Physcomitrium patens TaxID=3218 RepID=A0A7I4AMV6_PHYPA